jgi:hypothetical protein
MIEAGLGHREQLIGKRVCLFRREVETKDLHRDKSIARRLVRPEDRPENAGSDLMQNAEWSERWRRREPGEIAL